MIRYFLLGFFLMAALVLVGFGFRGHKFTQPPFELFDDMDLQPKKMYQESSDFFADGVNTRRPVDGAVPMGFDVPTVTAADGQEPARFAFAIADNYYNTGQIGDYFGEGMPDGLQVNEEFLQRGKQRYDINCAVCHGIYGDGKGAASKYGIVSAANFHLVDFSDTANASYRPDGSYFHTITHGKGIMGGYGANITIRDRWAIIAYIRTLQDAAKAPAPDSEAKPAEAGDESDPAGTDAPGGEAAPASETTEPTTGGDA